MSSNTNIGNTPVNQGYVQLIHMGETGGIDGTLRALYDGDGTASDLLIASDKVKISTELYIGSKTLTEFVQDTVGVMLTTGSYTNITTTYDDTNGNIDLNASGDVTLSNSVTLSNKTLSAPILTGTTQGASITLSGDLTVNGTTTTVNQTNLDVSDNIIGLNRGAGSNANDSGIIIERGSTGNNAAIIWDESADKFTLGTTTSTPSATGDLTISTGTLVANLEGNVTGNVTGSASLNLLKSSNLSDLASASTARTNLGVDAAGTDNSTNVTLAGSLDYITLSGQQITRNAINLTTDVTGTLPVGNGGTGLTSISTLLNSNVTPTSLGLVIGTNVLAQQTIGIANDNLVEIDDADATDNDYAKFTANGLEGRSYAEVRSDLGLGTLAQKSEIDDIDQIAAGVKLVAGESFVDSDDNLMTAAAIDDRINSAAAVTSYTNTGDNRVLTSVGGTTINGEANLTFDGSTLALTGDLNVGSGDFFVDDSAGNVGIGTASPASPLNVKSNSTSSSDSGITITQNGGSNAIFKMGEKSTDGGRFHMYDGGVEKIAFYTDGTANHISAGNVGIGTSSPSKKFVVKGASGDQARFEHNGAVGSVDIYSGTDGGLINVRNASGTSILELDGRSGNLELPYGRITDAGTDMNIVSDNALTLGTESGTALTIPNASTNVGIGTTSPGTKLEVKAAGDTSQEVIKIRNSSGTEVMTIAAIDSGGDGYINFNTSPGTINTNGGHLVLSPGGSGNVGIGTTSPGAKLDVKSQINVTSANNDSLVGLKGTRFGYSTSYKVVQVGNTSGNESVSIGYDPSGNSSGSFTGDGREVLFRNGVEFTTPNSGNDGFHNDILVLKDGKVGISTASPASKLHIDQSLDNVLIVSDNPHATTNATSGISFGGHSNGNVYVDTKTHTGGTIDFRCGEGTEQGYTRTWLQVDTTNGQSKFVNDVVAYASSDKRLKENIKNIDNPLEKISMINGITFDWINNEKAHSNLGSDIGVIAQEIEEVLPEVVTTRDNGYKAVKYEKIVPLLIEAIKEQQEQIEELKNG